MRRQIPLVILPKPEVATTAPVFNSSPMGYRTPHPVGSRRWAEEPELTTMTTLGDFQCQKRQQQHWSSTSPVRVVTVRHNR
jgi:hypothetical protein